MISLSQGQAILDQFEVRSRHGFGTFYILNSGISFEVKRKGTVLELNYDEIDFVGARRDKFSISWYEERTRPRARFRSEHAEIIADKISNNIIQFKTGSLSRQDSITP